MYLDRNARELVLRFAYAGQPLSGKTHSVRALMRLLKGAAVNAAVLSPHEENGRTAYFDWASYRGGSVQGNPVRCQIVTVPGQDAHAPRRKLLIESADVVVFVVDSDPQRLAQCKRSYEEILPWLVRAERSAIPVIFQCNKRDLPTAAPIERIREQLGLDRHCQLFESTATSGQGIRMAFIAALRAASARAVGLQEYEPRSDAARAASAEQLLQLLQRLEAGAAPPAPQPTREPPATVRTVAETARLPEVPSEPAALPLPPPLREPVSTTTAERTQRPGPSLEALRRDPPKQRRQPPTPPWSGHGPRPAVMPAADWHAFAPAQRPAAKPAAKVATPVREPGNEPSQHAIAVASPPPAASVQEGGTPKPRRTLAPTFETATARPAVMPIAAWREWLQAHEPKAPVEPQQDSIPAVEREGVDTDSSSIDSAAAHRPATDDSTSAEMLTEGSATHSTESSAAEDLTEEGSATATSGVDDSSAEVSTSDRSAADGPTAEEVSAIESSAADAATPDVSAIESAAVDDSADAGSTADGSAMASTAADHLAAEGSATASFTTYTREPRPFEELIRDEDDDQEIDSVPLPLPDQPLVNVWPVSTWQALSPHFYQPRKQATCQDGVWTGEVAPGWLASSAALFGDHETGLEALGVEVQRRERLRGYLWPYRCLVLCSEDDGYWRLWELVRTATTLDQILKWILLQSAPGKAAQAAGHLVMIGRAYLKMLESLPQINAPFTIDFSNIAQYERRLVYTGWMHDSGMSAAVRPEDPLASLAAQLRLHLPAHIPQGTDVVEICDELQRTAPQDAQVPIAELLCSLLMRYTEATPGDASAGVRH